MMLSISNDSPDRVITELHEFAVRFNNEQSHLSSSSLDEANPLFEPLVFFVRNQVEKSSTSASLIPQLLLQLQASTSSSAAVVWSNQENHVPF